MTDVCGFSVHIKYFILWEITREDLLVKGILIRGSCVIR